MSMHSLCSLATRKQFSLFTIWKHRWGKHYIPIILFTLSHSQGLVASCDGNLILWDPFVCSSVREYEAGRGVTYCVLRSLPAPSPLVATATSEGMVRLVDTRSQSSGSDLKVSFGAAGLIRSLAVGKSGSQLAVGHSSGYISLLDLRTGRLRNGFKAYFCRFINIEIKVGKRNDRLCVPI